MIRLVVRTLIGLAANAVGLIVAAAVLDGMHMNVGSFFVAVIIFTVVTALLQPFLAAQFRRSAPAALGGVALIATFVSLVVTDLLSDGFSINGVGTWIAATVITLSRPGSRPSAIPSPLYSFQNGLRAQPSSSGLIVWQSSLTSANFQPSSSRRYRSAYVPVITIARGNL